MSSQTLNAQTYSRSFNKQCNSKFDGMTILSNYKKLLQIDLLTSILIHFYEVLYCSCPHDLHFIPIMIIFMQNVQL